MNEQHPTAPMAYQLVQNYPNPFNASTTIRFRLPETRRVTIEVYDILGRRVKTLVDGSRTAGWHRVRFDGVDKDGKKLSSGVYLYRMEAGDFMSVRRLLLLK